MYCVRQINLRGLIRLDFNFNHTKQWNALDILCLIECGEHITLFIKVQPYWNGDFSWKNSNENVSYLVDMMSYHTYNFSVWITSCNCDLYPVFFTFSLLKLWLRVLLNMFGCVHCMLLRYWTICLLSSPQVMAPFTATTFTKLHCYIVMHSPSFHWLVYLARDFILELFSSLTSYLSQLIWASFPQQGNAIHLFQICYSFIYNWLSIIGCVKPPCDAIRGPAVRWKLWKGRCIRVTL